MVFQATPKAKQTWRRRIKLKNSTLCNYSPILLVVSKVLISLTCGNARAIEPQKYIPYFILLVLRCVYFSQFVFVMLLFSLQKVSCYFLFVSCIYSINILLHMLLPGNVLGNRKKTMNKKSSVLKNCYKVWDLFQYDTEW